MAGRKMHGYLLERLPEIMHRGMLLLEIDAIAALSPVIPEDVTVRKGDKL